MRLSSLFVVPAFVLFAQTALASGWNLDTSHSDVGFSVRHMMVSNTKGRFSNVVGTMALDDTDITKSKIDVEIDVASVDTREPKRDEHLRSEDFFDAKKFPKMTFKSTKIEKSGDKLLITGNLTIKSTTRSVLLTVDSFTPEVKDPWGATRRGASATTKISRKDFGLAWNKALETGGVLVGDEVSISLDLEFVKKN